ncbi:MAG: NADP-dependent oxidoreductase [Alcaligenaceae bacterium]
MTNNLCVRFVKAASGAIDASHFAVSTEAIPKAELGDIVVQNAFVSLDPYQRRQMMPNVAYANPLNLGDVMVGRAIGQVVESKHTDFKVGDWTLGHFGWQRYTKIKASSAEKINLDGFSASTYLGALGSPGVTAWVGLRAIAKAVPTDTVVISAATGAVGSVAAALARSSGCRVVGIAGGAAKCQHAVEKLGYSVCIDYRDPNFKQLLADATPNGIDVDFENVGGAIFDCVLERLNDFARIALCGMISQYNLIKPDGVRNIGEILNKNATLQGFRVTSYPEHRAQAQQDIKALLRSGALQPTETFVEGLEAAPQAFVDLFKGANLGKLLVQV